MHLVERDIFRNAVVTDAMYPYLPANFVGPFGVAAIGGGFTWFWVFALLFNMPFDYVIALVVALLTAVFGLAIGAAISIGLRPPAFAASFGFTSPYFAWSLFSNETSSVFVWVALTTVAFAACAMGEAIARTWTKTRR